MAKTVEELKAVDWNDLLQKLITVSPQFVNFLLALINAFHPQPTPTPVKSVVVGCDDETCCCCDDVLNTLADHTCATLKLHHRLCGDRCD